VCGTIFFDGIDGTDDLCDVCIYQLEQDRDACADGECDLCNAPPEEDE
jgi:hypothetical protein